MHALIIEDEPLIGMSIENALRECGYSSFALAFTVEQAVEEARLRCPDLISADVQLSPGCGIDAVAAICAKKAIPVIFVTGTPEAIERRRPGSVIVHKPFAHSDIKGALDRLLKPTPAISNETLPVDIAYYRQRAEAERSLATGSPGDQVAAIHTELAGQYEALANQPGLRSNFRIKWSTPASSQAPGCEPSTG